jgi:hypothetical protein
MPERQKPIPQLVLELRDLIVLYVKQETLVPLQALGRYVGLGVAGALLIGFGVVFLSMSLLRALQTTTDVFDGNWSFVPYLIVVVVLLAGAGITWVARGTGKAGTT